MQIPWVWPHSPAKLVPFADYCTFLCRLHSIVHRIIITSPLSINSYDNLKIWILHYDHDSFVIQCKLYLYPCQNRSAVSWKSDQFSILQMGRYYPESSVWNFMSNQASASAKKQIQPYCGSPVNTSLHIYSDGQVNSWTPNTPLGQKRR